MKVKNSQIIETTQAINSISSLQKSPLAIFALAKNHNKLRKLCEDFDEAKKKLWEVHFGDDLNIKNDDTRLKKYSRAEQELLKIEVDFKPFFFSIKDLDIESNNLSPASLSLIGWLIKDFDKE